MDNKKLNIISKLNVLTENDLSRFRMLKYVYIIRETPKAIIFKFHFLNNDGKPVHNTDAIPKSQLRWNPSNNYVYVSNWFADQFILRYREFDVGF